MLGGFRSLQMFWKKHLEKIFWFPKINILKSSRKNVEFCFQRYFWENNSWRKRIVIYLRGNSGSWISIFYFLPVFFGFFYRACSGKIRPKWAHSPKKSIRAGKSCLAQAQRPTMEEDLPKITKFYQNLQAFSNACSCSKLAEWRKA